MGRSEVKERCADIKLTEHGLVAQACVFAVVPIPDKETCVSGREGFSHIVPKILQSLPVGHPLPPHLDEGLELREEAGIQFKPVVQLKLKRHAHTHIRNTQLLSNTQMYSGRT